LHTRWCCHHRCRGPISNNISVLFCDILPPSSTLINRTLKPLSLLHHTRVQPVQFEGYV
jgi:hypothetical protein